MRRAGGEWGRGADQGIPLLSRACAPCVAAGCRMVHSTDIVELELNSKKFKLSVKKKEALEQAEPQVIHMPAPAMQQMGYAPMQAAPMAAPAPAA